MTTTPRRSARVAKMPDRLAPSAATTPQKRSTAKVSAFSSPRTPSKRQKTVPARAKTPEPPSSEEEASDVAVSETDDSDEESDFEQAQPKPKTPRRTAAAAKPKPKQKPVAKKAVRRRKNASSGATDSSLLEALTDEKAAVGQVAVDWIKSYSANSEAAMCDLVNLFVRAAGSTAGIGADAMDDPDEIAGVLEELQAQTIAALKQGDAGEEVLAGRTKDQRRVRRSVLQFVQRVIIDGQHKLVFADVDETNQLSPFVEAVLRWVAGMGSASFRPFRHVSTLVALAIQTALASVRAGLASDLQKTRRGRAAQRNNASNLGEHDAIAEAAFAVFYNTVFIYRCRDVHAMIRAECLAPLATWCRTYPAAYMDTEYLRFLGWALNDRDARVREAAVAAITGPLVLGRAPSGPPGSVGSGVGAVSAAAAGDTTVAAGIRPFVVRFLPRLVQVAAGDVDHRVQVAALKLVAQLARLQYIDAAAKIGDIRKLRPQPEAARSKRGARPAYSSSLSQQMLESSDESEAEDAANDTVDADFSVQVLYADNVRTSGAELECPRHTVMRYLAPLVAHTHATVRAAAAELVAWWLRDAWVPAARVAALGIDADSTALDDDEDDDGDDEDGDAMLSVDDVLATSARRARARRWLLFRAVGAFLWHVGRRPAPTTGNTDDDAEAWVNEQAAACIEEAWAAPAAGLGDEPGFGAGDAATALDWRIDAAIGADQTSAPPRVIAAALALLPRLPELGRLGSLASYLAWDHTSAALFALAPGEETSLLQAFAAWVGERTRTVADRPRRVRKKDSAGDDAARELSRVWHQFVELLTRNMDSIDRLVPLMQVAAEALDLQALFDDNRTGVIEAVAAHATSVLARYGDCVRLVRLAASFLHRVDSSRILRTAQLESDDSAAAGVLVCEAAAAAASQFGAAMSAGPDSASAFADVYAHVVVLRALIREGDITSQLQSVSQILDLVELAARSSMIVQTVPEKTALAALDVAYRFVLWRALRLDRQLQSDTNPNTDQLRVDRDRVLAVCLDLADAAAPGYGRLRDHAFMVLGRVQRLFSGRLVHGSDARRALAVDADTSALLSFFNARVPALAHPEGPLYEESPAARAIAYARVCALGALWAQWVGDGTVGASGLPALARYTGRVGTDPHTQGPRRVGFVALSAFDHVIQAGVDALRPLLASPSHRDRAVSACMDSLRASFAESVPVESAESDAVNVATLARFIGSALRMAAQPDGSRETGALAPAALGAAWAHAHEAAIDFGLALASDDSESAWESRVAPWFAALAQTVAGVVRPRHAEALDARLKRGVENAGAGADAAVASYQRALDRELAKQDAIRARMAGVMSPGSMMSPGPVFSPGPMSPGPEPLAHRNTDDMELSE
ncbi:cohesin complex subunit [Coemansia sp. RSA 2523]|nr:cohesin complex subunit [Coemansia sp. RSA 1824]KAJ1810388.1 cohesin complex subunit [Coemansia sp. RSA 2523]KAJ2167672.1 cohesin complex subunit [Coemansia sp. RSA 562]KAJ2199308.1 cohesin complex subunit [Coemansia sp. RSA 522]KAJ2256000.1 cohesin complex subunit [Coemansia sp. RSA 454]KAJ2290991.1 cohesin complex subunit [Coemansia sp. RSA 355]KAJ2408473.1 cohesin complex subunit [Coemansia sp. RSA 2526]KAJ2429123.1 cohesin complex subunit [Coemansia sp. RSA 2524]KAJ2435626.1 cohesin 